MYLLSKIFCIIYLGSCYIISHFPQQQMIRRVLATSLQLGGRLRSAEILVTVSAGYYQKFASIDVVLLRFVRFQWITIHFWTRIRFRRIRCFHTCKKAHMSRVPVRNSCAKHHNFIIWCDKNFRMRILCFNKYREIAYKFYHSPWFVLNL